MILGSETGFSELVPKTENFKLYYIYANINIVISPEGQIIHTTVCGNISGIVD